MSTSEQHQKVGSIWRKWDLHVHTPASGFGEEKDYNKFIENLSNSEADVIGLNDYATLEGYIKVREKGGVPGKITFPVIELRMNNAIAHKNKPVNKSGTNINFHIIIDPNINIDQASSFIESVKCFYEGGEETPLNRVKPADRSKVSFDYFKVIKDLEEDSLFKGRFLVWLPYDEYGGIDNIDPNNDSFFKQGLINRAHILGSSRERQIEFFLSDRCLTEVGKLIPCIKGSDSHELNYPFGKLRDSDSKPTERYCWIKADPTFEGLKQIVYEPAERVAIQKDSPELNFGKPYFSDLLIDEPTRLMERESLTFDEAQLPLNPNLVAIIGGRGEGKSKLVDYFASGFAEYSSEENAYNYPDSFKVGHKKLSTGDDEPDEYKLSNKPALEFLYIGQGEVKEAVEKVEKLSKSLEKMLGLEDLYFRKEAQAEIDSILEKEKAVSDWLEEKDDNNNPIHTQDYQNKVLRESEQLLASIKDESSKQMLENYTDNITHIQKYNEVLQKAENLVKELRETQDTLNKSINAVGGGSIPLIDFAIQLNGIAELKGKKISKKEELERSNSTIRKSFSNYKGDLSDLLNNANKYQQSIDESKSILAEIEAKNEQLEAVKQEKKRIPELIDQELNRLVEVVNEAWNHHLSEESNDWNDAQRDLMHKILDDREIEITGHILFDKSEFHDLLRSSADNRSMRNKKYDEVVPVNSSKEFVAYLKSRLDECNTPNWSDSFL